MSSLTTLPEQAEEIEGLDQTDLNLGNFPIDSLMIRTETRSVFETSRRIDSGKFIMDPDFQRDFVWDLSRQSKLIESALLRIPLPVFYLAETLDGKVVVVDGLQRLTSFHRFLNNEFSLQNLSFSKELNGQKFKDLATSLQNRLEDTPLTLYLIDSAVPDEAKYEIFERVNGGVPLSRQQMRNCLYVGEATRWLSRTSKENDFLSATGRSLNTKNMRDRECINRFLGFHLLGYEEYTGDMENFLNQTLKNMNQGFDSESLSASFLKSMRINKAIFSRHAFRKSIDSPSGSRKVINVALFDILSTEFALWDESDAIKRADEIRKIVMEWLGDSTFHDAISYSTNSKKNVHFRFKKISETLSKLRQ